MPHFVGSAIVIAAVITLAGHASAASIKTDWHDMSLTSDRTRWDADGTMLVPSNRNQGCSDVAYCRVF